MRRFFGWALSDGQFFVFRTKDRVLEMRWTIQQVTQFSYVSFSFQEKNLIHVDKYV